MPVKAMKAPTDLYASTDSIAVMTPSLESRTLDFWFANIELPHASV